MRRSCIIQNGDFICLMQWFSFLPVIEEGWVRRTQFDKLILVLSLRPTGILLKIFRSINTIYKFLDTQELWDKYKNGSLEARVLKCGLKLLTKWLNLEFFFLSYKCSEKVPKHLWSTLWTIWGNNNDICIDHVVYEEALYYSELRFDLPKTENPGKTQANPGQTPENPLENPGKTPGKS